VAPDSQARAKVPEGSPGHDGGAVTRRPPGARPASAAAWEDLAGKPVPLLVLHAGPGGREALLSTGTPSSPRGASRDRIVAVLTGDTDLGQVRNLVTGSCRILAPEMLTGLLDYRTLAAGPAATVGIRRHRARAAAVEDAGGPLADRTGGHPLGQVPDRE
jgi:hypothetical protein